MGLIMTILFVTLVSMGSHAAAAQVEFRELGEAVSVSVEGPIEVKLGYANSASASFNSDLIQMVQRDGKVTFTATPAATNSLPHSVPHSVPQASPPVLELYLNHLERLDVQEGRLLVKVTGSERLQLGRVAAPEICISVMDRARFDADQLIGERLQIALEGQGKAALLNVVADVFELDLNDHSGLKVTGETRTQEIDIRGYSHYDGAKFKSKQAIVALDDYAAGLIQASNTPTVKGSPFSSLSTRLVKPS